MSLRKNSSLGELGHRDFQAFLVLEQFCYIFVTVREAAFREEYVLEFCGERTQKYSRENRAWRWRQINSIYRWYLDLVLKRLCCINCLNAQDTNCATSSNQKFCCGTFFLDKNNETKNSSGLQLKAEYQKNMFSVQGELPAPPWLRAFQI